MWFRKKYSRLRLTGGQLAACGFRDAATIEVALRGGLGNQLFLFAAGLEVSRRLDLSLHLWTKPLSDDKATKRRFELATVVEGIATWGDESTVKRQFREKDFAYDSGIEEVEQPCRLEGYFQSAKYFRQCHDELITLVARASDFRRGTSELIGDYIAVQIRRGDYLKPAQAKFHGVVPISFFWTAVKELRERLGDLPVRVFSDDESVAVSFAESIEHAQAHVSSAEESPLYLLGVLSKAKGLVISNSSFGWWAAFLSGLGREVIVPYPWFRDPLVDTSDLLEPSWSFISIAENLEVCEKDGRYNGNS